MHYHIMREREYPRSKRILMSPAVLLALPASSPASLFAQQEAKVDSRDFVAWARENAVQLDSLEWIETDSTAFAFLDEALKGKRIVFLGESDHFVAERMEFRLLLIRELARRGFRRIGMEMGLSDGKRMDRYLETGDEAWLDRVALYGYRGDMREVCLAKTPSLLHDKDLCRLRLGTLSS